ncbi:MAG: DUF6504 family protein [Eubacteriales bacterium]|nr:DUF6504 family protein [Bacillota bacterium]MDQ7790288.1 DUF6504 family protein [Clostridia bacterium]MDZ4043601.1 DUF6504 family protein [Eubacteriales bacterium]MDZ7609534.1 DUF6504 family protein [Eubacteriales bacterium]
MARIVDRPVEVTGAEGKRPDQFCWRGRWYRVSRGLDYWKEAGRWWAGEAEKGFLRVQTATGGVFEIYRDCASKRWYLYKVYD